MGFGVYKVVAHYEAGKLKGQVIRGELTFNYNAGDLSDIFNRNPAEKLIESEARRRILDAGLWRDCDVRISRIEVDGKDFL